MTSETYLTAAWWLTWLIWRQTIIFKIGDKWWCNEGDRLVLHQAATGGISTLQREHSSEALAQDEVHENKACQSRNDDDYMRDKERTNTKKWSRHMWLRVLTWLLSGHRRWHMSTCPLLGLAGHRMTVASYLTTAITPSKGQSAPHQRPRLEWR